jgi:hypothetical protein
MINVVIHEPVFENSRINRNVSDGGAYCTLNIKASTSTLSFIFQNANQARKLALELNAIADILSGVTQ